MSVGTATAQQQLRADFGLWALGHCTVKTSKIPFLNLDIFVEGISKKMPMPMFHRLVEQDEDEHKFFRRHQPTLLQTPWLT